MFSKLKRKFVIINMSLLTFFFVAIFSAIYIITAYSVERPISFSLERIINGPPKPFPREPRIVTSLLVELNHENEIMVLSSFVNMDKEVIKEAVAQTIKSNKDTGKIKVGDFKYSFLKREIHSRVRIAFVDRSQIEENLRNILITFICVGGGSLFLLFLISVHLANRTIMPIKQA